MARITHPPHVDVRLGDVSCELLHFRISAWPCNLIRKGFDVLREGWIGSNWQA